MALGSYDGMIKQSIYAYKFRNYRSLGLYWAKAFYGIWKESPLLEDVDKIIPIPLHRHRLYERGFNQSLLWAKHYSALSGIKRRNLRLKGLNIESHKVSSNEMNG